MYVHFFRVENGIDWEKGPVKGPFEKVHVMRGELLDDNSNMIAFYEDEYDAEWFLKDREIVNEGWSDFVISNSPD